ncbi:MAG: hypothetical protein H0W78_08170 [Planctomycetes bacterium]|jgi:hypothetical protein|nr:hypothetical protein [Planctomycetota bacterium]
MSTASRAPLLLLAVVALLASGCTTSTRADTVPSSEEQVLLGQITRDPYIEIVDLERNDLEHLVVTTRQGSQRVRYVLKPSNPGEMALNVHRINDRSLLEISESDQLGTGPQAGRHGRYR